MSRTELVALTAKASWTGIEKEINTFWVPNAKGKKIYLTEARSTVYSLTRDLRVS